MGHEGGEQRAPAARGSSYLPPSPAARSSQAHPSAAARGRAGGGRAGSLYVAPPPPYPVKDDSLSRAQEAARLQPTIRRPQPESRQQTHKMGGERLALPTFCV